MCVCVIRLLAGKIRRSSTRGTLSLFVLRIFGFCMLILLILTLRGEISKKKFQVQIISITIKPETDRYIGFGVFFHDCVEIKKQWWEPHCTRPSCVQDAGRLKRSQLVFDNQDQRSSDLSFTVQRGSVFPGRVHAK